MIWQNIQVSDRQIHPQQTQTWMEKKRRHTHTQKANTPPKTKQNVHAQNHQNKFSLYYPMLIQQSEFF